MFFFMNLLTNGTGEFKIKFYKRGIKMGNKNNLEHIGVKLSGAHRQHFIRGGDCRVRCLHNNRCLR
jgi:hypothetical protein